MPTRRAILLVATVLAACLGFTAALAQEQDKQQDKPNLARKYAREAAAFNALPAESQRRIRQVHRELREEDSETRDKYFKLLQRYNDWVERLGVEDRKAIDEQTTTDAKLKKIRELMENQWIASLPKADRDLILDPKLTAQEKQTRIAAARTRQEQNELDWTMTLARMEERQDFIRGEMTKWREQLLEKLDPKERKQRQNEWKNVRQPGVARLMYLESKRLGVPIPKPFENLRFTDKLPPVDIVKLRQFMMGSEALRGEFEGRLRDPENREIALQELVERYWDAHPSELNAIRNRDDQLKKKQLNPIRPMP